MKNLLLAGAVSSALLLSGCSSSSSDVEDAINDLTVTVSGIVSDLNDAAVSGVTVEGVYSNPGDPLNPKTTSDASGKYSLSVIKGDAAYLHSSKTGYATMNTSREAASAAITQDITLPTTDKAQSVINAAYSTAPALSSKAWIVAGVTDASGNNLTDKTITITGATANAVYTDCDGSDIGSPATIGGCLDRAGPAYIASFDTTGAVTVTVGTSAQTVVLRTGEIADLEFEQ